MPYRIYEPLSTHIPVWFFIHSLPMWNGVCRTDPADRLTPCSSLSCCSMSQTLLWLPCFLFSKGIITIQSFKPSATDGPCRSAAHTFPSSITIPRFTCRLSFPYTYRLDYRQVFHREAHSLNHPKNPSSGCTGRFVSLKIPIHIVKHFRVSPYCYELVKVHILSVNIISNRLFRLTVVSLPKST